MPRAASQIGFWIRPASLVFAALITALFVTSVLAIVGDQTADRELGQTDLAHNMVNFGGPSALTFGPGAIAIDGSSMVHHVYVADAGNNRVLGWIDSSKLANGSPADLVIGQPDFFSANCNDGTLVSDVKGL